MSKLYIDDTNKKLYIFSYAGGTKFFRKMTEEKLHWIIPYDGNNLIPIHNDYEVVQIVRDPVQRYMSWFDKQYVKNHIRREKVTFVETWMQNRFTKEWFENFLEHQRHGIHYDGHTCYQSLWPRHFLKFISDKEWKYLRMEDINRYFFDSKPYTPRRDPNEYVGVWDTLDQEIVDYVIAELEKIYEGDIKWYKSLDFI